MTKYKDITNIKFGRLTAISIAYKDKNNQEYWNCLCDCGNTAIVRKNHLTSGKIVSCKCFQRERQLQGITSHGLSKTRIYRIYRNMINRCFYSKHPEFYYWGGRGIKVCDEWRNDFMNFYNWSMQNGYQDNLSIDRINVNGNYDPKNCRWATNIEQANNRRPSHVLQ